MPYRDRTGQIKQQLPDEEPPIQIAMKEPRSFRESARRLVFGILVGGGATVLLMVFATALFWLAIAAGMLTFGPVATAVIALSFLVALPAIDILYYLSIRVEEDTKYAENRLAVLGELFPSTSSILVSVLYVNVLVGVGLIAGAIGIAFQLPATLLVLGVVIVDVESLMRWEVSPVGLLTVALSEIIVVAFDMRRVSLSEFPIVMASKFHR